MTSVPAAGRTCALRTLKERDTMLLGSMSLARWLSRILCRLKPGPHPASLPQPGPNPISLLLQPSGSTYLLVSLVPTPTHFLCGILTSVCLEPKYGGGKVPNYFSLPGEVRLRKKVGTF